MREKRIDGALRKAASFELLAPEYGPHPTVVGPAQARRRFRDGASVGHLHILIGMTCPALPQAELSVLVVFGKASSTAAFTCHQMVIASPKRKADGAASCAESGSVYESHPIDATVASADFDLAQYRHRPCVLKIRPQRGGRED